MQTGGGMMSAGRVLTEEGRERLLFRRQFLLGPRLPEGFPSWRRLRLREGLHLAAHPDLPVYRAERHGKSVTLLGYLIDPRNPLHTDGEVVQGLLERLDTADAFFPHTYELGGRWVLLVDDGREMRLFNDAVGFRQVFYSDARLAGGLWCASQPGLIADLLSLEPDRKALEFIRSFSEREKEYWWPGDSSLYREVLHLLPNHFLDLKTGAVGRFWPAGDTARLSLEEAVHATGELLSGLVKGASHRFELALSLTAGRDTRLLLASLKEASRKVYCFTLMYWDLKKSSPDIRVPSSLLRRLGLKHTVIRCPPSMDEEFGSIYRRNVTTAREAYGAIAQGLFRSYPQEKVCVKGNAAGIAKSIYTYMLPPERRGEEVTDATLAELTGMGDSAFARRAFEKWLGGAKKWRTPTLLDLFKWENREGNWQAMSQLEWDIVQEVFVPYNCRALLAGMLSVDEQYRRPPEYALQERLIERFWPELLQEPINPRGGNGPLRALLVRVLVKARLHGFLKSVLGRTNCLLMGNLLLESLPDLLL
ncbi:MAG: hypothetical protein U0411_06255 [Thermodesulfovibrionales bacterium]